MTTLAANTSATITLDGDDVLTTDGNATFQITPTSGGKGEGYLTGHQTLGPYGQYVTIVLTSINNPVTYSQESDVSESEIARYGKDASGNITSLVSGDGTIIYLGGVLGQQNAEILAPTDTAKNVLYTLVIPAGYMRENDSLRITHNWICDNNANTKTLVFDWNGGAAASFSTTALTSSASQRGIWMLSNRNSLAAQVADASLGFIGGGTTAPTSTIDFAVAQTLTIALTKATGADAVKLMRCVVEILRGV